MSLFLLAMLDSSYSIMDFSDEFILKTINSTFKFNRKRKEK